MNEHKYFYRVSKATSINLLLRLKYYDIHLFFSTPCNIVTISFLLLFLNTIVVIFFFPHEHHTARWFYCRVRSNEEFSVSNSTKTLHRERHEIFHPVGASCAYRSRLPESAVFFSCCLQRVTLRLWGISGPMLNRGEKKILIAIQPPGFFPCAHPWHPWSFLRAAGLELPL